MALWPSRLAIAALALSACGGPPPSPAAQLRSWVQTSSVSSSMAALEADSSQVKADRAAGKWGNVQLDCVAFGVDASKVEATLPSPNASVTAKLHAAYHSAMVYAEACVKNKGRTTTSQTKAFSSALSEISSARSQITSASRGG